MNREIFTKIYNDNLWASSESKSGSGSELKNTNVLRKELSVLLKKYEIKSILDIPCGDFNWMKEVDFTNIEYTGGDIVDELIKSNKSKYPNRMFFVMDLLNDVLPAVDLVFVRDCLGHLSNSNVLKELKKIKKSGIKYCLVTVFTK